MCRLLPHIVRKRPYFFIKNPDYHLPLPPISRCLQKGIVTIQALYQAKSQDNNRFNDTRFLQDPRYNGNIIAFKKYVHVFPRRRTCLCKKAYLYRTGRKRESSLELLITKTYKHYGEIYQSLHRFRLSPDILRKTQDLDDRLD